MQAMPMFLNNPEWYTEEVDADGNLVFHLTDAAPEEARKSYENFYNPAPILDENGNDMCPPGCVCE